MRYRPTNFEKFVIAELDVDSTFEITEAAYKEHKGKPHVIEIHGKKVNVGYIRYHILNKTRRCACCGLIGTRMFLCKELSQKIKDRYSLYLMAENRHKPNDDPHLVLMTMDHILERRKGGKETEDNLRCLCISCNQLRDNSGLELDKIKTLLFSAYKIYKSTIALNKTQEVISLSKEKLERYLRIQQSIKENIHKAKDKTSLLQKLSSYEDKAARLEKEIRDIEINSQVTGQVYGTF